MKHPGPPRLVWAALLALTLCVSAQAAPEPAKAWTGLSAAQQKALAPLHKEWASIDTIRRQKWLEVAARFETMPEDDRQRLQARMAEWAKLTPAERAAARLQFQEASRLPEDERQAQWRAYQALSSEERGQLAQRAKPAQRPPSASDSVGSRVQAVSASASGAKRNVVTPGLPGTARIVAPTVVQAKPGATTTTMTTRASPPLHHQTGLPKIAATAGYVDQTTLLPRRGPQGAAVRAKASTDPAEQP